MTVQARLLSLDSLERFLDEHGMGQGPLEADRIGDGHSNITYLLRRGADSWVLRRPPPPPLPPSAHDVLREYRILRACDGHVRVPSPLLSCADPAVIGAPFYLMTYVPGEVLTTALTPQFDPRADPPLVVDELVQALVEIHALDWRATELADLAPAPEKYVERQLRRFTRLWEHNRTRSLPVVDKVTAWLRRNRPRPSPATLVHGDYRLGNTIFSRALRPRLEAVLDWELATIGDPLADLGYLSATYAVPGEAGDPLVRLGAVTAAPGFPSRAQVVERYAAISGRDVAGLAWYEVMTLWKSAIFLEGSYGRLLGGTASDPFFSQLETGVPELAERAWALTGSG